MPPLEDYLRQFATLNRAPLANSPLTLNRYPNKPLLLLAILDLIGARFFDRNRIYLCPEVTELFDQYWDLVAGQVTPRNVRIPFEKLQSSSFWHLTEDTHPFTRVRIAQFDRTLFTLAQDPTSRSALQNALIDSCFAPEVRDFLREATRNSEASIGYSEAQLRALDVIRDAPVERVRSQAFRTTIVRAYDYRCAICGIRIFSRDGRTAVEAAHIRPWSVSRDDNPTNGLSLCRLCHWAFDAGLLGVTGRYTVLASKRLTHENNLGGHLVTIAERPIFAPQQPDLKPDPAKLEWHREHIFTR